LASTGRNPKFFATFYDFRRQYIVEIIFITTNQKGIMKMKIRQVLAVLLSVLCLLALVSCNGANADSETTDTDAQITAVATTDETLPNINTMDLSRYIRALSKFFYEPCDALDPEGFREDILCLLFSFCEDYGEPLGFAHWDEEEESLLIIEGEGLRRAGKLLLGEDFRAEDYHDALYHGCYREESDTSEVSFATDYWGGASVEIPVGTQPSITETAYGAEIVAEIRFYDPDNVGGEDDAQPNESETVLLRYIFESVVSDDFRYYRLVRISEDVQ
jgi:hypothetical protein